MHYLVFKMKEKTLMLSLQTQSKMLSQVCIYNWKRILWKEQFIFWQEKYVVCIVR